MQKRYTCEIYRDRNTIAELTNETSRSSYYQPVLRIRNRKTGESCEFGCGDFITESLGASEYVWELFDDLEGEAKDAALSFLGIPL